MARRRHGEEKSVDLSSFLESRSWRRVNAWGSQSYAELIARAIRTSSEGQMTLGQIYAWLIENIEYFGRRSDAESSAGWKNSIRHNLSLHSRFVRLQNDGRGKSSWWKYDPSKTSMSTSGKGQRSSACDVTCTPSFNSTTYDVTRTSALNSTACDVRCRPALNPTYFDVTCRPEKSTAAYNRPMPALCESTLTSDLLYESRATLAGVSNSTGQRYHEMQMQRHSRESYDINSNIVAVNSCGILSNNFHSNYTSGGVTVATADSANRASFQKARRRLAAAENSLETDHAHPISTETVQTDVTTTSSINNLIRRGSHSEEFYELRKTYEMGLRKDGLKTTNVCHYEVNKYGIIDAFNESLRNTRSSQKSEHDSSPRSSSNLCSSTDDVIIIYYHSDRTPGYRHYLLPKDVPTDYSILDRFGSPPLPPTVINQ